MKKVLFVILVIIIIFAAIMAGAYFYYQKQINTTNQSSKPIDTIEIKDNTSSIEVSDELESMGAIKSSWIFLIYQKIHYKQIKAGIYSLPYNLSARELVDRLSSGEFLLTRVTIAPGKRAEQIAAMLEEHQIFGYSQFLEATRGYEGRLYPDSYLIGKKTTASDLVRMMTDNFSRKTAGLNLSKDQLVLASIVERETNKDEDRALVAGIFANRLEINMKLESDPTVLFVNDSNNLAGISPYDATQYYFWKAINFSLYKTLDSPYNTYVYTGLPPAAICNPGLASLKAAISPQANDYLFFFHDSGGTIHPTKTYEEHQVLKQQYL